MKRLHKGFSIIEILLVLAIIGIILGVSVTMFSNLNKYQALEKDEHLIVSVLNQARTQTLSSQNDTQYGVHFASTTVTLFTGSSYASTTSSNSVYSLNSLDSISSLSLTGGGNDVIFNRLTGQTGYNGTIVVSTSNASTTKTITIYKTGLIDLN